MIGLNCKSFCKGLPKNFAKEYLNDKCIEQDIDNVFRIAKFGVNNDDAFLSTFEEVNRKLRPKRFNDDEKDPSYYATSCFNNYEMAKCILGTLTKKNPKAIMLYGKIKSSKGVSCIESNRHISWWIYQFAHPSVDFNVYE